ncbi:general secretion pathway protein J [Nitrosococcus oceani ATCC 19707]|uniref:General secretion pathway protein J n=2 Tax=Nitrosococcus oceani TaxID=1229 RepID=Q3JD27_NITOC|nr:prepilin-type N-terminal cleavage/methylation domain-containing protein [Nitrosococcus oceani]ABA57269.1 general secretion pathway protein J [Nitrosococcus oceani ATCC 19707]EDZ66654.1 prepilin-type N-terminal cleavage/methylation domain protein [Nitrosococcus oceani AFC27]KFI20244.1 general secretion pathway protein GspJ [Nitrosococcus oceani C-27]GEM20142.1 general secretion pathway protein GspJ [Nitrosococcus oceani]
MCAAFLKESPSRAVLSRLRPERGILRHRQGFTLVELLIAMTLVGMILVILFSALRLSTRSWEATEKRLAAVEKVRAIEGLFRRQIREQKLLFYSDPERGQVATFAGTPNTMQFVAPLLTRLGLGGLYWIIFEVIQEGGESRLVMRWWPYRPAGQQEVEEREEEVLLKAVETATFSYFGREVGGTIPEWRGHWENPQEPPQLVRVEVHTQNGAWPELVVPIRTEPSEGGIGGGLGMGGHPAIDFGSDSSFPGDAQPIPE